MRLRATSPIEIAVQAFLLVLLAACILDYAQATQASPCPHQPGAGCYPWGAEGPVAGVWDYSGKELYLKSALAQIGFLAAAIAGPFFMPGMRSGLGAMIVIVLAGRASAEWLVKLL